MTRYFSCMDDAYSWVEAMMNRFDNYTVKSIGTVIRVEVF